MKFATIGTSKICEHFIEAAKESGKLQLAAVYSRSEETAIQFIQKQPFLEKKPGITIYTNLEKMAKSNHFSIVYIASPNSLHFQQALLFIQNGKHVICEKPIFSNKNEWQQAFKAAEAAGVYLFEAIRNIHDPNFLVLQKSLSKVGDLKNVVFQYCQQSSRYQAYLNGEEPNVFSLAFSGGTLVDLGVYPIYLAIALFGKPLNSYYVAQKLRTGVDGTGTLILQYHHFQCTIICSKTSDSGLINEIQGSNGVLLFKDIHCISPIQFISYENKKQLKLVTTETENNMIYEINHIVRIIKSKDRFEYHYWRSLSEMVLTVTELSRKQNNILYHGE